MLEGNFGVAHFQCKRVLGRRYQRLDPKLPEPISLDDLNEIPKLMEIGKEMDLSEKKWLGGYFRDT